MQNKKSILIIGERFHPEEFGINNLAAEWKSKGYKVSVLTHVPSYPYDKIYEGYKNKLFQKDTWNDITIYRVYTLLGYQKSVFKKVANYCLFVFLCTLVSIFIHRKFDCVFVYQTGPLSQALPLILLKKLFRKRTYIWTLDLWPDTVYGYGFKKTWFLKLFLNGLVKSIYRNCSHIFVSNYGFIDKIKVFAPKVEISFAPQWVPLDLDFSNAKRIKKLESGFNFTFAGNVGKVQNLENVIKGFAKAKKNSDVKLNIVGDGSRLNNLKKLVKNKKIKSVIFHGRKPLAEMPGWFIGSDVLIISLTNEASFALTVPAKFQAYLFAGKPIFCIAPGETAKLVFDNKLGYCSDPDDIDEISFGFEKFISVLENEKEMMSNNAAELVEREYSFKNIVNHMTEVMGG